MKIANALTRPAIVTLTIALLAGCGNDDRKTIDKVEILSESVSPNEKYIVTVFSCAGGGAAGYTYTNVNLRETSKELDQRDFLLGKYMWNSFTDITADWKDSETLEISYRWTSDQPDYRAKNEQTIPKKGKVKINYILKEND